ncbi:Protein of unknown function DUF1555 [Nitrosococcus oceani ATCC 19707]|uniref:Ice-binding protein C-terminal domain-containing protein n=2 Tax=Nitrosococcus oceani TaxID=1229 RepID=Q3J9P4_NITOC|nr:PEP-CTERM sorting domain-containing protein [Nitrosococcus oceani]ABA58452.1 Protein of unknown function DUF1555 [Nitrosococcus oceani ATCC 19707]EDZ68158.1 conserved hypothetical protein [Nitrosococcus oceani AFC27]KFI19054.1 hypothetical protein IB75_10615 [Nitrosococcus oceani C-27]GEM18847.1 PEP-CTERM sorting domain-containing protein [Nitrosococcus oceani]
MKKTTFTTTVALGILLGTTNAHALLIDPDGGGGAFNAIDVHALDWNAGSALAVPDEGGSFKPDQIAVGDTFTQYAHAELSVFNDASGNANGTFIGSGEQWTFVLGFREEVVSVDPTARSASFSAIGGGTNFFEIWYGDDDNDNLEGTGFNNGTKILSGTVSSGTSNFDNDETLAPFTGDPGDAQPLDNFGNDDRPGIRSVTGSGGATINISVSSFDSAFFTGAISSLELKMINFDTSLIDPFNNTNPADCFTGAAGGGTVNAACNGPNNISFGMSSGDINGFNTTNFEFQQDAISNLKVTTTTVPEPSSIFLLGTGLAALGFAGTRKRRR